MFVQIDRQTLYLRILTVFAITLECHSVHHSFCNDMNPITNAYSFGRFVFITQAMKTIWRFDSEKLLFSKEQETLASIFGTGW